MRIYLFRHGQALAQGDPSITSDAERPLVEEGIRKTQQAVEGLVNLGIPFDAIFTSPWLRARQTAKIACDVLKITQLQDMAELAGDRAVEDVMRALGRQSRLEHIMLVGHNPLLGDLASYFLTLSTSMQIDLRKTGICAVEIDRIPPRKPGTLLWMMTPKQLRALR